MFRKIEEVQIGGEAPGEAFGGFIYGLDVQIGFNGQPTSVSVNVVSENGIYKISKRDLSTIKSSSITIGNEINFGRMYLKDYTISSSPDAKLLHLNYIDRTVWLKKIYLGLINTHGNPTTLENLKRSKWDRGTFKTDVPIQCYPCSYADVDKPLINFPISFRANYGYIHNVDEEEGGAILLGTEEFGKNHCELKQVTYNWNELVHVLKDVNIEIAENPDTGEPSISDRGRSENRERFSGSLDEVISQWCDKMGYSWGFDPETEKIYGIDLTNPIESLQDVKNKINSLNDSSKIIVTQSEESNSLDGTKVHNHISSIRRPFHKQSSSETSFARAIFKNIKLEDILAPGYFGGGRTLDELIISASLAKYDEDARKVYNMILARDKARDVDPSLDDWTSKDGENFLEPLGMTAGYRMTDNEKELYVNQFLMVPAQQKKIRNFQAQYGLGATAFVGTYSKALEKRWVDWEKQVADFIGKYYYVEKPAIDFTMDDPGMNMQMHRVLTVEPKSVMHTQGAKKKFPFSKLLENHPITKISPIGSQMIKVTPCNCDPDCPHCDGGSNSGYEITSGVDYLVRGATYTILHSCDPQSAWFCPGDDWGDPPRMENVAQDYFKFYTNTALTAELKGHSVIPNPGGGPKVVITIPDDCPDIVYHRGLGDSQFPINVIDDPQQNSGDSRIWIHTSDSAWGTAISTADKFFNDPSGKSHIKSAIPQYKEINGFASTLFLPALQNIAPLAHAAAIAALKDGFDPVAWIMPSQAFMDERFSPPDRVECCTLNEAESLYETSKKSPPENKGGLGFCDVDLIKQACRCVNPTNPTPVKPTFTGKVSPEARYISFSVNSKPGKIILPVEQPLVGYHIIKLDLNVVHRALEKFYGQIKTAGNTMGLSVKIQDITNDLEEQMVNEEDVAEKIDNYSTRDYLPGVAGAGRVRKEGKIIVANKSWAEGKLVYTAIDPRDYHNSIDHSHDILDPTERFTCSVLGLDFSEIKEVMKPSKGLSSMSISYSANGIETSLTFSNRQLGGNEIALMKEQTFHRLEPLIGLNRFGRTF